MKRGWRGPMRVRRFGPLRHRLRPPLLSGRRRCRPPSVAIRPLQRPSLALLSAPPAAGLRPLFPLQRCSPPLCQSTALRLRSSPPTLRLCLWISPLLHLRLRRQTVKGPPAAAAAAAGTALPSSSSATSSTSSSPIPSRSPSPVPLHADCSSLSLSLCLLLSLV